VSEVAVTQRVLRGISLIFLGTLIGVSLAFSLPRQFIGDIAVFVGAGRLATLGQNPYGVADITPRGPNGVPFPNLSPPVSVLLFQQIAWVDPAILFRIWYVVSLALYVLVLLAFSRGYPGRQSLVHVLWALAIFPLWLTLGIGQVQVALLALATVAWLAIPARRDVLAGIAIGVLIAWKPNFVLWPILLFLAGRRRTSLTAVAVSGILSLWPVLVYGPSIYREWIDASLQTTAGIGGYGLVSFLANDVGLTGLGLPLSALLILCTIAWAWRARPNAQRAGEVALIVSLLALPVTNAAYFVLLMPIFLGRVWTEPTKVAACLLVVPWPLLMSGRLPWPYAIVLVLLLGYPPAAERIRTLIATPRSTAPREQIARDALWLRIDG
jgi:Glycosyltransferase family 87